MTDPRISEDTPGAGALPPRTNEAPPLSASCFSAGANAGNDQGTPRSAKDERRWQPPTSLAVHVPTDPTLFAPAGLSLRAGPPERPLRVVVLTSIRDVGGAEGVGSVRMRGSGDARYLQGTVETLAEGARGGLLEGYIDIVGIVTDDRPEDLERFGYPVTPTPGRPWIHPLELRNAEGTLLRDLTTNIPSTFRSERLNDAEARARAKFAMETSIFRFMRSCRADILLSDHYMARIDYLCDAHCFPLHGRVLNTHCGPIRGDHPHPFRGPEPYLKAIQFAEQQYVELLANGLPAWRPAYTGATLHLVSPEIDAGTVICEYEATILFPEDSESALIERLYRTSKSPAVIAGLRHYATNIFPHLAELSSLDFEARTPPRGLLP